MNINTVRSVLSLAFLRNIKLDVIDGLEKDPIKTLRSLKLLQEIFTYDYSCKIHMRRKCVEYYGSEEMIKIYDTEFKKFKSIEEKVKRNTEEYYFCMIQGNRIDMNYLKKLNKNDILNLADEVYKFYTSH